MAGVNNSYDIGTAAGSRFRHLHLTGDFTSGTLVAHAAGLMATVDNSYDLSTGAGSRFRHLHLMGVLVGSSGSASAPSVVGQLATTSGLFWPAAGQVALSANGAEVARIHAGGLMAGVTNSYDLGTVSGSQFRHLHLSGALTLSSAGTASVGYIALTQHTTAFTPVANALYANNLVKGWVKAQTDGATADGFNVASVIDVGVGIVEIVWDVDFSNTAYAVVATAQFPAANSLSVDNAVVPTAGVTRLVHFNSADAAADPNLWMVIAIGDQ